MKVSVVTAVFNGAETIADTLDSVAAQTYPDVEHVVVDGGSRDNTLEVVKQHGRRVARLISERDRGVYDGMNKGIRAATGEVIGTLNADDVYADPDVLARVAAAFADPSVEVCYGDLVYVKRDDTSAVVRYWKAGNYERDALRQGWFPPHPTFFVRRALYERGGLFNIDYPLGGDVELMMRLLWKHQAKAVYIPNVQVKMRLGGISNASLRSIIRQNVVIREAARLNGLEMENAFVYYVRKLAGRARQFVVRPR